MRKPSSKWLFIFTLCITSIACNKENNSLQGYVDADYTYISSNFSGNLMSLDVAKGNKVQKGDLLFTLDVEPQKAQLQKAKANLNKALAQTKIKQEQLQYHYDLLLRYRKLARSGGVSREQLEEVKNHYLSAKEALVVQEAAVESFKAEISEAQWNESNKKYILLFLVIFTIPILL